MCLSQVQQVLSFHRMPQGGIKTTASSSSSISLASSTVCSLVKNHQQLQCTFFARVWITATGSRQPEATSNCHPVCSYLAALPDIVPAEMTRLWSTWPIQWRHQKKRKQSQKVPLKFKDMKSMSGKAPLIARRVCTASVSFHLPSLHGRMKSAQHLIPQPAIVGFDESIHVLHMQTDLAWPF